MEITQMAEHFKTCEDAGGACIYDNCPLQDSFQFEMDSDFDGSMIWKIEACLLFARFISFLKDKEPGILL